MASQPLPLTLTLPPSSTPSLSSSHYLPTFHFHHHTHSLFTNGAACTRLRHRRTSTILSLVPSVGKEDTDLRVSSPQEEQQLDDEPTPRDLEYVAQIKRVLELLKKNRDMLFGEVKLTIMIEDPREVERRRLLGIEDLDGPTRDDLAAALEEVNEGKIPKDRAALQKLAEEMTSWPNVEAEAPKKKPAKSLYAKTTDTGIDPQVVAKRLNIDWDSAAEIQDTDTENETEVPSVLGYGALYLVTALPVIIGIAMMAERGFPVTMMDEPKILIKESSQKGKHIVVDALSLRESSTNQGFYDTALSTVSTTLAATDLHLPSLQPASKPKFLNHSLPNSANSSPLFASTLMKRKSKCGVVELHLRKSRSCGEGRASAATFDEFDLLAKPSVVEHDNMHHDTFSKTEAIKETTTDEGFKCSDLCMYLPGFGKAKAVKTKKEGSEMEGVISRIVSLEKSECGSWTSSKLFNEIERDSTNSFFDLPMLHQLLFLRRNLKGFSRMVPLEQVLENQMHHLTMLGFLCHLLHLILPLQHPAMV